MKEIGLHGGWFQHAYSSTLWKHPTSFTWAKNVMCEDNCFVDAAIVENISTKCTGKKFAWVLESSTIIPHVIQGVIDNAEAISASYDFLIAHDKRVYDLADNFYYLPPHGYWIEKPALYPKTKLVSMISSGKRMCAGHNYRLDWVNRLNGKVDIFGRDLNPFDKKEDVLCDYMFCVTIENSQYETYWTEKILDCFATGTVPIYHGAPDIADYFNMDGVIILDDTFDPSMLTKELYISKKHAIKENLERALKFNVIEDIMYKKFIAN